MFIVRDAQRDAFKQNEAQILYQYVLQKFWDDCPQHIEDLDEAERSRRLQICIAKAKQHGFSVRDHTFELAVFMFTVTPAYEQHEDLHNVLEDKDLAPEERLAKLKSDELSSVRAYAIKKRHRKAWQRLEAPPTSI